jgi:hypothetical protein
MTKTLSIALAAALFTAGAQAADSYRQFTAGNPDIRGGVIKYEGVTAVQPGVGSDFDRYHGLADGNGDLFSVDRALLQAPSNNGPRPDIYGPFGKSPDIGY